MLSPQEEQLLEQRLVSYDDSTSTQIVIVTVPNLGGAEPIDYAVTLGREWGVGQAEHDNGVVVLVSRDDRSITIATGYGLEGAIPDVIADRIRRNVITPYFREGRFYEGLAAGAEAIMAAARGEFTAEDRTPHSRTPPGVDLGLIFVIFIILYFVFSSMGSGGGKGRGKGGGRRHRSRFGGPPIIIWGGGGFGGRGGGFGGGGFGGFGGGGGGFGGFGGGSFGGGGASGSW